MGKRKIKSNWDVPDENVIGSKLWWEKKEREKRAARRAKRVQGSKPPTVASAVRNVERAARRRQGIARGMFGKF